MALSITKEAASNLNNAKKANGPAERSKAPETFASFERGIFLNEHGANVNTDNRGRRIEGSKPEKIYITKELIKEYKGFLSTLFIAMQESKRDTTSGQYRPDFSLTTWGSDPSFQTERDLFTSLTNGDGVLVDKKVDDYLKEPRHIMLIEEMLENHLRMRAFGLALTLNMSEKGDRSQTDKIDMTLSKDQGAVNALWKNKIWPVIEKYLGREKSGGRNVSATDLNTFYYQNQFIKYLYGGVTAGGVGWAVGASGLALLGIPAGLPIGILAATGAVVAEILTSSAVTRGLSIDKKKCVEGLMLMKDPARTAEAGFLRDVLKIDVDDWNVDASGKITAVNTPPKTENREKILRETIELVHVRLRYHGEIGVDDEDLDALLEQAILDSQDKTQTRSTRIGWDQNGSIVPFEQTRSRAKRRILEIYIAKGGTFDPFDVAPTVRMAQKVERLGLLADARIQYMQEIVREDGIQENLKQEVERRKAQKAALESKITNRGKEGQLVKDDRAEIESQTIAITSYKTTLTGEAAKMKDLGNLDAGWEEKEKAINTLLSEYSINVPGIIAVVVPTHLNHGTPEDVERSAVEILRRMTQGNIVGAYPNQLKIGGVPIGPDSLPAQLKAAKDNLRVLNRSEDGKVALAKSKLNSVLSLLDVENQEKLVAGATLARAQARLDAEDRVIDGLSKQVVNPGYGSISAQKQVADQYRSRKKVRDTLENEIKITQELIVIKLQPEIRRLEKLKADRENDLTVETALATSEKQRHQDEYSDKESELNSRRANLETARTSLQTLIADRNAAKKIADNTKATDENFKQAVALEKSYVDDCAMISRLRVVGRRAFSINDLLTLPVSQIMERINEAHRLFAADPILYAMNSNAWPEGQNGVRERQNQVLHAVIEIRAEVIRSAIVPRPLRITNEHRRQAVAEYAAEKDRALIMLEADRLAVPKKYEGELAELNATNDILTRATTVLSSNVLSVDFVRRRVSGAEFIQAITTDPKASPEELALAPLEIGYFEILDLLTGYKSDPNRGKLFSKWTRIFPPDEIAEIVNVDLLGNPATVPPAPRPNLAAVIPAFRDDIITTGRIGAENIINFIKKVTDDKLNAVSRYK